MRSFFIAIFTLLFMLVIGCTSVVTSVKPISLYKVGNKDNVKSDYLVLDGIPYFLPKSMIHVDITWNANDLNWTVLLTPVIQPDSDNRFMLRPNSNALFDDNINLSVDSNGLLQTVNTTTTDKTVSSLADLVAAAGSALTFGAALAPEGALMIAPKIAPPEGGPPPPPTLSPLPVYSFHGDFEPDPTGIRFFRKDSNDKKDRIPTLYSPPVKAADATTAVSVKADFTLTITPLIKKEDIQSVDAPRDTPIDRIIEIDSKIENVHGIVVRLPVPYQIDVTVQLSENPKSNEKPKYEPSPLMTQSKIIMLPDKANNYVLPISRRYLVSDQTNVTLKDGMIQGIQQSRPSMVAGVVGIPKTILGALLPIPTGIRSTQSTNLQYIDNSIKTKAEIKKLQSQ
ncbi:MAG: hypothetical protein ACHQ2F_04180 [Desulfobaccales bacterium]